MKKFTFLFMLFFCAKMAFGQWETVYFPETNSFPNIESVEFIDFNHGFAAGHGLHNGTPGGSMFAYIIRTSDNGNTWDTSYVWTQNSTYSDISFFDLNKIIAVGQMYTGTNRGIITKSDDFGDNWSTTETFVGLNAVYVVNSELAYIAGNQGVIYKTINSGLTWDSINTGNASNLMSIFFVNDTIGFACSSDIIIKTTDGGYNWSATNINAGFLDKVFFPSDSVGYCKTRGGASVSSFEVYKTYDQGYSWNLISTIPSGMLQMSMFFSDKNVGYVVGQFSVFKTIDGGLGWSNEHAEPPGWDDFFDDVSDVYFLNSDTGFIVGAGQFYRTVTGGYHSSVNILEDENFELSYYPNPAKTVLNVRFEKSTSYNLTLFSMDGRMVLNEKSNSEHHVLNIASLDKGVYLLKVSDNNRSRIVKVVIQ